MINLPTAYQPIGYNESRAYVAIFLAWFIAQAIKVTLGIIREKRFNFRWIFSTGGMPSSHSSVVSATAAVTGYYFGFTSIMFAIVVVFAMIIMSDAAGLRRASGKQASVLNKMIDDIYEKGAITEGRLGELLGHTPIEVFAGMALGILIVILLQ
jgi:uncharacterized protein